MTLSKTTIETYCGEIKPLWLGQEGETDMHPVQDPISWSVLGNSVVLRVFSGEEEGCFTNGVLVIAVEEGESRIYAEVEDQTYMCTVTVRKARTVGEQEQLFHYRGDLHIHTSMIHKPAEFAVRTEEFPGEIMGQIDQAGLDFAAITDHALVLNNYFFFKAFVDEEVAEHGELIVFPGCESGLTGIAYDRYQVPHKEFGEIVTLNAADYADVKVCEDFCAFFEPSPAAVGILAHPQEVGWDAYGVWVSALDKHAILPFRNLIRLVEMGDGTDRYSNLIHEYTYSHALDCGYRVAPCCNSDSHGAYQPCPGKTFVMAPEKSKEMFLDAMRNARVYASESGLVQLEYTVNGHRASETLPLCEEYGFHVELKLLADDKTAMPKECKVISDYGAGVLTISVPDTGILDFQIHSESARYFYLRFQDQEGRRTWSAPVWTGRDFDNLSAKGELTALDKKEFCAYDEVSKTDAQALISDDPGLIYESDHATASIVIDMKKSYSICGLGHTAPKLLRSMLKDCGQTQSEKVAEYVSGFRILTSCDDKDYKLCLEGSARVFGCEEIFTFPETEARYVKFEVLETTGKASGRKAYENARLRIGELSIFAK